MQTFLNIYNWLRKNVNLPSAFSWQTLIVLSAFSFYMAILASGFVKEMLIHFGWIFLILGVYWGTTRANELRIGYKDPANPGFPVSPWITGALVSIYIFGVLIGDETGEVSRDMIVSWPIISAILAILPDYLAIGLKPKVPAPNKRLDQALLLISQILLSCWFQFHFVVQDYIAQYPSMMADDFRKSAFVVKFEGPLYSPTPRGAAILDAMEPELRTQLNTRAWPIVERSLLPNERKKLIDATAKQAKQRLTPVEEDELWNISSNASAKGSGYNLELRGTWEGPRSQNKTYTVTKSCQITPIYRSPSPATKPLNTEQGSSPRAVSRVECQPTKGWAVDQPVQPNDSFIRT